jgi:hypothetical protein
MAVGRGASQHPWIGYFAPVSAPFLAARPAWVPPNASSVLGPRPGAHSNAYPVMYSGQPAPASSPYSTPAPYYYSTPHHSFDHAAMIHAATSNASAPPQPEWIMDSSASSHVTGKTTHLSTFHSPLAHESQHIIVGSGSALPIVAVGSVQISPSHIFSKILFFPLT